MGRAKQMLMEQEEQSALARDLLCEVGALEECENHPGTFYDGGADVEDAYKLANARITSGQITLGSRQTRRDVTDLIKSVYDDNSGVDGCQECDKNFGRD